MVITEDGALDDSESRRPAAAALELLFVTGVPVEKVRFSENRPGNE
jgi:hypothetical protein